LPKYDPIESREGSLFLWDAGINPTDAFNTVQEAEASKLTNALNEYALPIIGSTVGFDRTFQVNSVPNSIKTEITAKGGLHCMASQSTTISNAYFIQLASDTALNAYLANKAAAGKLYISQWRKTTRKQGTAGSFLSLFNYRNGGNYLFADLTNAAALDGLGAGSKSLKVPSLAQDNDILIGQPQLVAVNPKGATGTITNSVPVKFGAGTLNPSNAAMGNNRSPSVIYYRIYIEDLELSGRTFEEVAAIDQAEFNKAFALGGRFHGDSWSNPAVALP
ncbi:hypothetical protein, partial [Acinetobacter sp. AGC35]